MSFCSSLFFLPLQFSSIFTLSAIVLSFKTINWTVNAALSVVLILFALYCSRFQFCLPWSLHAVSHRYQSSISSSSICIASVNANMCQLVTKPILRKDTNGWWYSSCILIILHLVYWVSFHKKMVYLFFLLLVQ
jgi:hypothetical protein